LFIQGIKKGKNIRKCLFISVTITVFLLLFLSGCIESNKNNLSREWRTIDTWSGIIYNGTVSVSLLFPYGLDSKMFVFPIINADNLYHYVSNWKIVNSGTVFEEIEIFFDGEMILSKNNETNYEMERLSIGDNPNLNDISMKIFIDQNSTDNDNFISLSKEISGQSFTLKRTLAPLQEIDLFFYVKSYNKTISGKYQSLFQTRIISSVETPIFNRDFELTDIKANEFSFNVAFDLILTSDISIGDIKISTPNDDMQQTITVTPIYPKQSIYRVNIPLRAKGDSFKYPFDEYNESIELNAVDEVNTEYINLTLDGYAYSRTTKDWHINVSADNNQLHFIFTRNQEVTVFWILISTGITLIVLRLLYVGGLKKKVEKTKSMKVIFYIGEVISIPFYFGVIFNYIIFNCPQLFTIGSIIVFIVLVFSILLGAYIFIKEEENKEKNNLKNQKRWRKFNIYRFRK